MIANGVPFRSDSVTGYRIPYPEGKFMGFSPGKPMETAGAEIPPMKIRCQKGNPWRIRHA